MNINIEFVSQSSLYFRLVQGSSNLTLEAQSAAEFSSDPDQTHLWFSNDLEDSD